MAAGCIQGIEAARKLGEQLDYDFQTDESVSVSVESTADGLSVSVADGISYRFFDIEANGDLTVSRSGEGFNGKFTSVGVFTPDAVAKARAFIEGKVCKPE